MRVSDRPSSRMSVDRFDDFHRRVVVVNDKIWIACTPRPRNIGNGRCDRGGHIVDVQSEVCHAAVRYTVTFDVL